MKIAVVATIVILVVLIPGFLFLDDGVFRVFAPVVIIGVVLASAAF